MLKRIDLQLGFRTDPFLHNKAHRGTEWTELNTMHRGVDGTKSDRDEVYRILMPFGVNASCTNL